MSEPINTVARDPGTCPVGGKSISGLTRVSNDRVLDNLTTVRYGV